MPEMQIEFDVPAQMRDGTVLRADVYRPAGTGPWPVLLMRLPYGKQMPLLAAVFDPLAAARRGFMVVIQDTRGRFASEGEWEPLTYEESDGYDTVRWAAALPGANGSVGMLGASYFGNTQWMAALSKPPELKAIAPMVTWSDPDDGLWTRGGAIELGTTVTWSLLHGADTLMRRHSTDPAALVAGLGGLVRDVDGLASGGYAELPAGRFPAFARHDLPELGYERSRQEPDWARSGTTRSTGTATSTPANPRRARPPPEWPGSRSSTTPTGPPASCCRWYRSAKKRRDSRLIPSLVGRDAESHQRTCVYPPTPGRRRRPSCGSTSSGGGRRVRHLAMGRERLSAGGFLWALVDEGIVRDDLGGAIDVAGNAAPDGILGPFREKEASFYTIKDIWSPVQLAEPERFASGLPDDFAGRIHLINHYAFTNTRACLFTWRPLDFRTPSQRRDGHTVRAQGTASAPDIEPGAQGVLRLPLPYGWPRADAIALTVTDADGREIRRWTWTIESAADQARRLLRTGPGPAVRGRLADDPATPRSRSTPRRACWPASPTGGGTSRCPAARCPPPERPTSPA